jgi:hypothetical protein
MFGSFNNAKDNMNLAKPNKKAEDAASSAFLGGY